MHIQIFSLAGIESPSQRPYKVDMNFLVSFEVIQISSFWGSQLISRKFAVCSLPSFSKVTSKYDHVSKVHSSTDVFVFKYALFVFLDYI